MQSNLAEEEWNIVRQLLPPNFEKMARESGALKRARGIENAETLLRLILLHVGGGLSLEQTCLRAREHQIADVSAVALFKRLRCAGEWLRELNQVLVEARVSKKESWSLDGRKFRILDATDIREPGATGSSWRLHYSLSLPELACDFFEITDSHGGETLVRLPIKPSDIILVDRGYGRRSEVAWVKKAGADVIMRLHAPHFPTLNPEGDSFDVLSQLRDLKAGETRQWNVRFKHESETYTARLCAIRKSQMAANRSCHKIETESRRKGYRTRTETLELAHFIVVLTTLPQKALSAISVLELYRCRWQVELAFKRLKSLLSMGHVPKLDPLSARAWIQAKILTALLIERLLERARLFSPWGYDLSGV